MGLITSSTLNDPVNRRHGSSYVRDVWHRLESMLVGVHPMFHAVNAREQKNKLSRVEDVWPFNRSHSNEANLRYQRESMQGMFTLLASMGTKDTVKTRPTTITRRFKTNDRILR
jgi:hypothetical protein